ncbi:MAG TPA: ComF family protein [Anaerolineae bacterium]|nr:ComF family protein [Anaerolineae bacterium]
MQRQSPTLSQHLWRLLFPPRCVACRQRGELLCPSCLASVRLRHLVPAGSLHDLHPLSGVRSAAEFAGPMRQAVHHFKYGGLRALAPTLGKMLADNWSEDPYPADLIVPVPLHSSRLRQRGYNQSALLARELGCRTGLPVSEQALTRKIATPPQVGLNAHDRTLNMQGAFACEGGTVRGRAVVVIDDVMTTGATLRACAEELLAAGASRVWGLTLAAEPTRR